MQRNDQATPTPVISHAILQHNKIGKGGVADGIIITPSHNPPSDGGIKYNPPNGGPADTDVTAWMEKRANELLATGLREVKRLSLAKARAADTTQTFDYVTNYVNDLGAVIDFDAIKNLRIGVDPLGNASVAYWEPIAE